MYSFVLFSQKEANIWYFGQNAGLDFNSSPPTALTNGALNTYEGCSSFSDANGNLLFYSDGITVWNKNHQIMTYTNGILAKNLRGNPSSTQSGMIIPKPSSNSIYYLFTVGTAVRNSITGESYPNKGFNVYTIDMSLNNGLGSLIDEDNDGVFYKNLSKGKLRQWSEKVAAVKGKECSTYWVVSSTIDNQFYSYKIDENGINLSPVISEIPNITSTRRGYLKLSPDGTILAVANQIDEVSSVNLLSFDNGTGKAILKTTLKLDNDQAYGIEFSRNSKKLYVSTIFNPSNNPNTPGTYKLFQYDLSQNNISASKKLIHHQVGQRGALQLGPDGKIYATIPQSYDDPDGFATHLSVIENPNENADDIIFTHNAIYLNGKKSTQGLPPFISSLLSSITIKDHHTGTTINEKTLTYCAGASKTLVPEAVNGINITYQWSFDNGTTSTVISNNRILAINPLNKFHSGKYKLLVSFTDVCGEKHEKEGIFHIKVYDPINATQPENILFCDVDGIHAFNFQELITPQILASLDSNTLEVVYFLSEQDAINNENNIPTPYTNKSAFNSETIYARIQYKDAPNACYDIKSFTVKVVRQPNPNKPSNYIICDVLMSGFYNGFVLNTKDREIISPSESSIFHVSYHKTLLGAQTDKFTDVIDKNSPYKNENKHKQTIYVRIENINNPTCIDTSLNFDLIVQPLPEITPNVDLTQCDTNKDGFAYFNLNEANRKIIEDFENHSFVYFESFSDATNHRNPISYPMAYENKNIGINKVWATVTSIYGCTKIAEINLTVTDTKLPDTFHKILTSCDDFVDFEGNDSDADGIGVFNFLPINAEIASILNTTEENLTITYYTNELDAATETNQITNITNYRNTSAPNAQEIYVRVDNQINNDCIALGHHITLEVVTLPKLHINTNNAFVCIDNPQTRIEVDKPDLTLHYEWQSENEALLSTNTFLDVVTGGTYKVTSSTHKNGVICSRSEVITLKESSSPTIEVKDILVTDDRNNSQLNIYTLHIVTANNNLGIGDYQFALVDQENNQTPYQEDPFFENLSGGIYTVIVNDKNGCRPNAYQNIAIFQTPKFFTPNGDGFNDTWKIKGINASLYEKYTISIFDRFGKLITKLNIDGEGWDGTYQGQKMPSSDYWFNVSLTDKTGENTVFQGHFSLLRK